MISKLYNTLAIFAIGTLLAASGFAGYLAFAGQLTGPRLAKLAAVVRGELDEPKAAAGHTPSSQPADAEAEPTGRSADEIRKAHIREQMHRATLERAAADVAARQALLNQSLQHLITLQEEFEQGKKTWATQKKKMADALKDDGFQRELAYVIKLQPKQAKEHVLRTWQSHKEDVVRLFVALDPGKGQKILEQFKTPDELQIMHELLEQLRLADVEKFATTSGKTPREKKH